MQRPALEFCMGTGRRGHRQGRLETLHSSGVKQRGAKRGTCMNLSISCSKLPAGLVPIRLSDGGLLCMSIKQNLRASAGLFVLDEPIPA